MPLPKVDPISLRAFVTQKLPIAQPSPAQFSPIPNNTPPSPVNLTSSLFTQFRPAKPKATSFFHPSTTLLLAFHSVRHPPSIFPSSESFFSAEFRYFLPLSFKQPF